MSKKNVDKAFDLIINMSKEDQKVAFKMIFNKMLKYSKEDEK